MTRRTALTLHLASMAFAIGIVVSVFTGASVALKPSYEWRVGQAKATFASLEIPVGPLTLLNVRAWANGYDDLEDFAVETCRRVADTNRERTPGVGITLGPLGVATGGDWVGVTCTGVQHWTEDVTVRLAWGETRWSDNWPLEAGSWYSSRSAWDGSYYSSIVYPNGSRDFYGPVVLEDEPQTSAVTMCQRVGMDMFNGIDGEDAIVVLGTCGKLFPDSTRYSPADMRSVENYAFMARGDTPRTSAQIPVGCSKAAEAANAKWAEDGLDIVLTPYRSLTHSDIPAGVVACSASSEGSYLDPPYTGTSRVDGLMICASDAGDDWAVNPWSRGLSSLRTIQDALTDCIDSLESIDPEIAAT